MKYEDFSKIYNFGINLKKIIKPFILIRKDQNRHPPCDCSQGYDYSV